MAKTQKLPNDGIKDYMMAKDLAIFGNFAQLLSNETFKYSGFKLHIYATNADDIVAILDKIYDLVKSASCMMKAATPAFFSKTQDTVNPQHGKGITIYMPFDMVNSGGKVGFISLVKIALSGYEKSGNINGDTMLSHNLFERYELNMPWEQVKEKGGLNQAEYDRHYNPNA